MIPSTPPRGAVSSAFLLRVLATPALLLAPFAACSDTPTESTPPDENAFGELTVDAADAWAFVELGDPASVVPVDDPTASNGWDIGLFATSVMLNGGDAGPAGIDGYCLCQNAGLAENDVMALTDEDGLTAFEAVTLADVPGDEDAWTGDALVPAIDGWWSYDMSTHTVSADPAAVFKVRAADGAAFAKVHVTALDGATQQYAGTVTVEFAVQGAAGAPFGATETLPVDVSGGAVAIDLETASIVAPGSEGWDLELAGYTIRVNGGVSGDGDAGAVRVDEAFEAVSDAGDLTAGHYRADAFGGVFAADDLARRWYRYNLQGNHQIWPTFNAYLVRRGADVYKVQLTGYYDPDSGDARHITIRYQRLES